MEVKNLKLFLLILVFFQSFNLLSKLETTKNENISNISKPIIILAKRIVEKRKNKEFYGMPFISIAGCTAVGKSEFTNSLSCELEKAGIKIVILKQDDFILPLNSCNNFNNSNNLAHVWLNHREMHRVASEIKNGKLHVNMPNYDWITRNTTYKDLDLTGIDIVLFEGLYVLNLDCPYDFGSYANIKIFIYAKDEDIKTWAWRREQASANAFYIPMNQARFSKYIKNTISDYHKYVLPQKKNADFVIEKDKNHNYLLFFTKN